jgi:hypothetical protein
MQRRISMSDKSSDLTLGSYRLAIVHEPGFWEECFLWLRLEVHVNFSTSSFQIYWPVKTLSANLKRLHQQVNAEPARWSVVFAELNFSHGSWMRDGKTPWHVWCTQDWAQFGRFWLACLGGPARQIVLNWACSWCSVCEPANPSLVIYFFPTPPMKLKLGLQIG